MMLLHILYFELNHCRLTGFILIDTHVRKELGVYTCLKEFSLHSWSVLVFKVKLSFGNLLLLVLFCHP